MPTRAETAAAEVAATAAAAAAEVAATAEAAAQAEAALQNNDMLPQPPPEPPAAILQIDAESLANLLGTRTAKEDKPVRRDMIPGCSTITDKRG